MKYLRIMSAVAALGVAAGGYAVVRELHGTKAHVMSNAQMPNHLSKVFRDFAAFDLNKDGQLDASEQQALGKAIDDGSVTLPPQAPTKEMFPSEEQRLNHFADMYARFAVYDANHDGELDSVELRAVQTALENGDIRFTHTENPAAVHAHRLNKYLHAR